MKEVSKLVVFRSPDSTSPVGTVAIEAINWVGQLARLEVEMSLAVLAVARWREGSMIVGDAHSFCRPNTMGARLMTPL